MKVPVREIPCHRRFELGPQFVGKAVAGLPMRAALERPDDDASAGGGAAEVDLYMEDQNIFVRGQLDGWVEVACSRCVGPVKLVVAEPIAVTYLPHAQVAQEDEELAGDEVEVDDEDMDVYSYEGEEVDLEPLLREQLILAVPFAPLCSEDCKGLCPVCGIDLNTGSCTCDRTPIDPRWAALRNLKP
ncbi:MAG TPA: DUF177 domain-containing protein [Kofleriaceae bacterium]|nr:DUF177 domain-containing protein [Kofleriaceae bacterium]